MIGHFDGSLVGLVGAPAIFGQGDPERDKAVALGDRKRSVGVPHQPWGRGNDRP